MACQFSPSLCTAAAKGDTATVEKHLQAQCCNPSATNYFINPHEDPHSPNAVVGFVKRKRNVTVMPKNNGDHSSMVKPASPLQVALYYKEEGVLFLLLNHFLKICNGNVSRCYDETSEAIATANGYSHLMDFFQYYDCINRDSFGSCWTEAMRHICDLTTKLNKYRKHNAELLQERDDAMKGRDQAILERDALAKDRAATSKSIMEHKDALILRLQQSLRDKENAMADLQEQVDNLRSSLSQITGSSALETLRQIRWDVKVGSGTEVCVTPVAPSSAELERESQVDNCTPLILAQDGSDDLQTSQPASSNIVSECMRHQAAVGTRLLHLRDYVQQCKEKNDTHRAQTVTLVDAVQSQCAWSSHLCPIPDLRAECGLRLGADELHLFDYGDDVQLVEGIIRQLEYSRLSNASTPFSEVARQKASTAYRVRDLLSTNDISNESSVHTLDVLVAHLEKIFSSQSTHHQLLETEEQINAMEQHVQQAAVDKTRSEESGSVLAVERQLQREMELQRQLLECIKGKLDLLQAKSEELSTLSSTEELFTTALQEIEDTINRRQELASKCEADRTTVQSLLATKSPQLQQLQDSAALTGRKFLETLNENDLAQCQQWEVIAAAFTELQQLQDARAKLVKTRLEQIMSLKKQETEHEIFVWAAEQHAHQLLEVSRKCQVSIEICQLIMDIVQFGQDKIHDWFCGSEQELDGLTLAAHQQMYERFRDWYLTQGEYTHKKKMLLKDVRRKIAETDNRKQLAIQRLDSEAETHGETLKQLEQHRLDLETIQIPRLETTAAAALPLFTVTRDYLTKRNIPFIHPDVELQQRNEKREMEIHMREVSKYQELLLASQKSLFECSTALPDAERVLLLENHHRIAEVRTRIAGTKEKENGMSEMEENRLLKLRLQEYFVLIPLDFLDPITLEIIADPVTAADGHTYERTSISRWLQRKTTSPKTGESLAHTNLTSNFAVRDAIQQWKSQQLQFLEEQQQLKGGEDDDDSLPVRNEGAEPPISLQDNGCD